MQHDTLSIIHYRQFSLPILLLFFVAAVVIVVVGVAASAATIAIQTKNTFHKIC